MRKAILSAGALLLCWGCGPSADEGAANQQASSEAAKPKRPSYCFFKEAETKEWKARRDKSGNVVVSGKAYRSDPRYKAVLGAAEIAGAKAEIGPSITVNDTGFAAPDNWWSLEAVVPDSGAVETVLVRCGERTLATLSVPRSK